MIYRPLVCTALLFLLLIPAVSAPAQDAAPVVPAPIVPKPSPSPVEDEKTKALRAEIEGCYSRMDKAFQRYDVNAAVERFALDYVYVDKGSNKINLSGYKQLYRKLFARSFRVQYKTEINLFEPKGDTITVETTKRLVTQGKADDGTPLYVQGFTQDREFWVNRKGKWLLKQSRVYDFTLSLNGQLLKE